MFLSKSLSKPGLLLALSLSLVLPLAAAEKVQKYLPPNVPNGIELLAPPPMPGTAEYKADLELARMVFKGRTKDEEERAFKDATLSIFNFAPIIGDFFNSNTLPKTAKFFVDIKPSIRPPILAAKDHWKRTRPYDVDKSLYLGKPEESFSYPSGHSSVGMTQALILAELFPDKREPLLEFGRTIGWDRVLIGKHFPTDVIAGRVMGQAIVRELKKNAAFRKDLEEIRAEIQAARALASNQKPAEAAK
jgi:hypothetical protein